MARVGLDLDGVCYDFGEALKRFLVDHEGWDEAKCTEPVRWEFYEDWGLSLEEFVAACDRGVDAGVIFTEGAPQNDAAAQVDRLVEAGHTVHIITDRSFGTRGRAARSTIDWLFEHGIRYSTIDFTADKASVARDLLLDYMIDDKPENIEALRSVGVKAVMQDRPWNRGVLPFVERVTSLEEFVGGVILREGLKAMSAEAPIDLSARAAVRKFDGGATRDSDTGKYDFEGFLSPQVLWEFASYMHKHRVMSDGSLRDSDNWQAGMPLEVYMKSLLRHVMDLWLLHRGHQPVRPENGETATLPDTLGGIMFNLQGYWLQSLRESSSASI